MVNAIPVCGWLISVVANASLAVPFWLCWTVCGIGATYFGFLPPVWQAIPFWNCVGLFICASVAKAVFVPNFASVTQTNPSSK